MSYIPLEAKERKCHHSGEHKDQNDFHFGILLAWCKLANKVASRCASIAASSVSRIKSVRIASFNQSDVAGLSSVDWIAACWRVSDICGACELRTDEVVIATVSVVEPINLATSGDPCVVSGHHLKRALLYHLEDSHGVKRGGSGIVGHLALPVR